MNKKKTIIISLSISLIILIILNYIIITNTNSEYIKMYVFKENVLKGKTIESKDIATIKVKKDKLNAEIIPTISIEDIEGKILSEDVSKGEVIILDKLFSKEDILESDNSYKYISIPIEQMSLSTCIKLKRGDKVTIYFTAKSKDVSNAIKDKRRLYSNTINEGLVTCLLFEAAEVISTHDSTGKETKENLVTDVLVRLSEEDAMLVANLKSQGTFDIVLN